MRVYAHRHTQRAGLLFSRIYARRGHVEELFISVCARPCVHKYIPARARELSRGRQIQLSLEIHRHTRSIYKFLCVYMYRKWQRSVGRYRQVVNSSRRGLQFGQIELIMRAFSNNNCFSRIGSIYIGRCALSSLCFSPGHGDSIHYTHRLSYFDSLLSPSLLFPPACNTYTP